MPTDPLRWHAVDIDGHPVRYADGGRGPVVLVLHGWALGPAAYARPMRQLVRRGCRVIAPALPGLGGTAALPAEQRGLGGYGSWVSRFLDTIGIEEQVMVIGHSFGGGAAITFAHGASQRVAYLILLNAVGGGRWSGDVVESRPLADRPLLDWLAHFSREGLDLARDPGLLGTVGVTVGRNLLRNPLGLWHTAHLARRANLTAELAALRRRGIPVLATSSTEDSVIPKAAFDALCAAIGTDGHVISGRHSWLLTDPDRLDDVLGTVVDLEVARHRAGRNATRAEELCDLLGQTAMPPTTINALVSGAPALWLMSDDSRALAADLALCHPALLPDEVRAVVRPVEDSQVLRLTVVAHDRPGLLADSASILASEGVSVTAVSAITWPDSGLAMHALTLHPDPSLPPDWDAVGRQLGQGATADLRLPALRPDPAMRVVVEGDAEDRTMVVLEAVDQVGLLAIACRALARQGASVESLGATVEAGRGQGTFIVRGQVDRRVLLADLRTARRRRPAARASEPLESR